MRAPREVEHRSAKRSSAGAPTAGLHVVSTTPPVCKGFGAGRGGAAGGNRGVRGGNSGCLRPQETVPSHLYTRTMRLVRLELTFGTSGELLCLVAGPDINRT